MRRDSSNYRIPSNPACKIIHRGERVESGRAGLGNLLRCLAAAPLDVQKPETIRHLLIGEPFSLNLKLIQKLSEPCYGLSEH